MSDHHRAPRVDVERNRRLLLDAAIGVLLENPGASMEDVAHGARLTRTTLYRHFKNRKHLLEAIRDEALARAGEAVEGSRLDEGGSVEALGRFVRAVTSLGGRFGFLLAGGADLEPGFAGRRAQILAPLLDVVRRGQATGEIRADLPADWVVTTLVSLLTAGVRRCDPTEDESADLILNTLLRGISAPS